MRPPLLVFGASGQVGRELMALAQARRVEIVGLDHAAADITDGDAVARAVARVEPRMIVNCAAYTAVDRAESEPDAANAINALAPGLLAKAACGAGVPILHLSTDYVFDGAKSGAYRENDAVTPIGVYGQTKAAGESAVRRAPAHVILRTAWVYGQYGSNFLKTMLRLVGERDRLRVVADQRGCPTATADIAEAILAVDRMVCREGVDGPNLDVCGTYHFTGQGETSWYGFAQAVIAAQAPRTGRRPPVDAIATTDYPTPARRPANSVLDSDRFAETFGYRAERWTDRVQQVVDVLLASESPKQRPA